MPVSDPYKHHQTGPSSPARRHFAISPSDDLDLPIVPKAVYCEAAGALAVQDETGAVLIYTLAQGQILPIHARRIRATGTTATVFGWV